ncbi:hypothetical protein BDW75DRAFT_8310 [Aspergillus navahoensis]
MQALVLFVEDVWRAVYSRFRYRVVKGLHLVWWEKALPRLPLADTATMNPPKAVPSKQTGGLSSSPLGTITPTYRGTGLYYVPSRTDRYRGKCISFRRLGEQHQQALEPLLQNPHDISQESPSDRFSTGAFYHLD